MGLKQTCALVVKLRSEPFRCSCQGSQFFPVQKTTLVAQCWLFSGRKDHDFNCIHHNL